MTARVVILIILIISAVCISSCIHFKEASERPPYTVPLNEGIANIALTDMEREVVRQMNELRANPSTWVDRLTAKRGGTYRTGGAETGDGIDEAVFFLEKSKPLPPLRVSKGLCRAAGSLVVDHGPKGLTGHKGSDGSSAPDRMNRYGQYDGKWAENLYYGYDDADRLVTALLTEGGSRGWNQRNNVFNKDLNLLGIACGSHHVYRTMCVMVFAEKYAEVP